MSAISMTMPIFPLYVEELCGANVDPKTPEIGMALAAAGADRGALSLLPGLAAQLGDAGRVAPGR